MNTFRFDASGAGVEEYSGVNWHTIAPPVMLEALRRDDYVCQICGFTSTPRQPVPGVDSSRIKLGDEATGYMQISHINGNHSDNDIDNLLCVCPFCHLSDHPFQSILSGSADLVFAPGMSQFELNALAQVVHMVSDTHLHYEQAQAVHDIIMRDSDNHLRSYVSDYPSGSREDNQEKFCRAIMPYLTESTDNRHLVAPLRLFPKKLYFSEAIDYWLESTTLPVARDWKMAVYG
jgi:hypothetical protein